MTCLSYTTQSTMPSNDWASIKTFVDTLMTNLNSAGLIRVAIASGSTYVDGFGTKTILDYNTSTFTTTMSSVTPTSTYTSNIEQYLFSFQYGLPVGDGSILTGTHPSDSR